MGEFRAPEGGALCAFPTARSRAGPITPTPAASCEFLPGGKKLLMALDGA
jgi:hypothetical protein